MSEMELILSLCIGLGLSAACGYRVFVPLLGLSMAAATGHISLPENYAWIGSTEALAAFLIATIFEIGAYYIPWVDNAMDSVATPVAVVAGTIVMSSFVTDASPFLKWSLAIIAGGGTAAIFQVSTASLRTTSTVMTAGMGNFTVATVEAVIASLLTLFALFLPFIAGGFVLILVILIVRFIFKSRYKKRRSSGSI
jgi:hypothetical protein